MTTSTTFRLGRGGSLGRGVFGAGESGGESHAASSGQSAVRVQMGLGVLFLAARSVHVGQAMIDLTLGNGAYSLPWAADAVGAACVMESLVLALLVLRSGRLTAGAVLGDAAFGVAGLAVMSAATSTTLGRAGSLNWMLPYTVGTAVGFGLVAAGDLRRGASVVSPDGAAGDAPAGTEESDEPSRCRRALMALRGLACALTLAGAYVASAYVPRRLPDQHLAQILGNAANYPLFFVAALLLALMLRRGLGVVARREAQATRAAADLAHEGQWRAVVVDVFGPVVDLLQRVAILDERAVPAPLQREAGRLIAMIEAVNPIERAAPVVGADPSGDGTGRP